MRRMLVILGIISLILMLLPAAFAQSKASLSGTVKDATGAVIPGASIVVSNQSSGDQRKTVSNKEGFYSVPLLPVGVYVVTADAKGFAKYEARDITLSTSDTVTVNITLPLQTVSAKVEVSALTSEVISVDSGEKSDTINSKELTEIGLSSRNAAEYIKIMAGAVPTANGGLNKSSNTSVAGINGYTPGGDAAGLGGYHVNGQTIDITMDGGHIFDPGSTSATPVNPNSDMVSEVKVLSSNFSAESEKGPVVMNVTSKHGGKDFHGEGYLYVRPQQLAANDWFAKHNNIPRQDDAHYYYPGGQIGGPILIPGTDFNKNRDKLFFHTAFEYYGQKVAGNPIRAQVPTAAMYNGDFSQAQINLMQGTNPKGLWNGANQLIFPIVHKDSTGKTWTTYGDYGTIPGDPVFDAAGNNIGGNTPSYTWAGGRPNCKATGGVLSAGCMDTFGDGLKLLKAYLPAANADPNTHDGYNFVSPVLALMNMWQSHSVVDYSVSDNTKFFVRADFTRNTPNQPLGLWGGSGGDMVVPAASNVVGHYKTDSYSTSLTHVFSPTMTSETTFAYTFEGMPNKASDYSKITNSGLGLHYTGIFGDAMSPAYTAWGTGLPNLGQGNGVGESFVPGKGNGSIANKGMPSLTQNLSKVLGTHSMKFGFFWEKTYNKQDNWGQYQGVYQMPQGWGTGVGNNYADILMGLVPGGFYEQQRPPAIGIEQMVIEGFAQDHWKLSRRLTVDFGMRFDHIGKPYTQNSLGLAVFDASKYSDNPADLDKHTGVLWHGIDKSVPKSGADGRLFFYSPRFGLSYDLWGNGGTVIRGGWGMFRAYDSLQSNNYVGPAQTGLGAVGFGGCNGYSCPTLEDVSAHKIVHPLPAGLPAGLVSVNVVDPNNDNQPLVTSYSFSIDQRLPGKFTMELSYVGNNTKDLLPQIDINAVPVHSISNSAYVAALNAPGGWTTAKTDALRPRHNYEGITADVTSGKAQYDSFQAMLRRSVGWLTLQANYNYSKAFRDTNGGSGSASGGFADMGQREYYSVDTDNRPHTFSGSYVINLPNLKGGNAFVRGAASGWQIAGITQLTSGANLFAQNVSLNYSRDNLVVNNVTLAAYDNWAQMGSNGIDMRAKIICNPNVHEKVAGVGTRFLNPACFAPADPGTAGTTNSPYLQGPKYFMSDLTLTKNFQLTERQRLSFRIAAYNFLNHPLTSFTNGDANLNLKFNADGTLKNANNFGIAQYKFGARSMELMVKYSF